MKKVIAALDATAAARPVLQTALRIGEMARADVEAVHVREASVEPSTPAHLAKRDRVHFRVLDAPVGSGLLRVMESPEVIAGVLGARATSGGRRPVGHVASQILLHAQKPVVVVPPVLLSPRPFRKLLVPLEGLEETSKALADGLSSLFGPEVELVVLHVFTNTTLPRMLDRPYRDLDLLATEFRAKHLPNSTRAELRTGAIGAGVVESCTEQDADLVVLCWHQIATPGRASVVREVLSASGRPVLLLPVPGDSIKPALEPEPERSRGSKRPGSTARARSSGRLRRSPPAC
jgi:nucleotide-binding universal stress UspA family protein